VITKGIKPAIDFNGTSHNLSTPDYLTTSLTNLFFTSVIDAVSTTGTTINIFAHYDTLGNQRSFFCAIRDSNFSFNGSQDGGSNNVQRYDSSGVVVDDYLLYSAVVDTTIIQKVQFYKNNSAVATQKVAGNNMNLLYNSTADFNIGRGTYEGTIQELIFYPSDESSNRTGISDNINDFYSIY
jgi:hypothetical protein